jgi:hypothetical protein
VRHLDDRGIYHEADVLAEEDTWADALEAQELAEALRSAMRQEYADASEDAMYDALDAVLGSMTPAEALDFSSALKRISAGADKLVKDPTFVQVASVAAPMVGGLVAGPAGAALGTLATKALHGGAAPPPAPAPPAVSEPVPSTPPTPPPGLPPIPAAPAPASSAPPAPIPEPSSPTGGPALSVAGGSAAAAQVFVLTHQIDVLRSLLATALGRYGCEQVSGIPVAQVLAKFSQLVGHAAEDADRLMYTEQQADISEGVPGEAVGGSDWSLYEDLIRLDNVELAEAAEWEGLA